MAHAENQVFINRPRSVVFDFVADGLNVLRWRPGIAELNLISGRPDTPGATYRLRLIGPFGRRFVADFRITKVVRDTEINFEVVSGLIRPKGAFYFEVVGAGTAVKYDLDYNPAGLHFWKEPIAEWVLDREVDHLETLREAVERYHGPLAPTSL